MIDACKVLKTSCSDATSLQHIESINSNRLWYIRHKFTKQSMIIVHYMASIVLVGGVQVITKSKASQIHFRIPKEVSEIQCPEKTWWKTMVPRLKLIRLWPFWDIMLFILCLWSDRIKPESWTSADFTKKCQHVKLSTPYFYLQFLCIEKPLFSSHPNLKTKSPPSLRQPTMYVFHRRRVAYRDAVILGIQKIFGQILDLSGKGGWEHPR